MALKLTSRRCIPTSTQTVSPVRLTSNHVKLARLTTVRGHIRDKSLTTSEGDFSAEGDSAISTSLPFQTAAQRLQDLLETVSWESEDELLRHEVASLVPEMKLTLFSNLGSILTLAAFITSWLTGEDPLGGFAMTDASLVATAEGAGYALPLILCSVISRLEPVRNSFPVLDDLHGSQQEIVRPIVEDLNSSQLLILASVLVLPTMLLLLPAAHGAFMVASHILAADLLKPMGLHWWHVPAALRHGVSVLVPAVCSAYFAAWVVTRQLDVSDRQVLAIRDAFTSADRYFLHAAAERAAERPELLAPTAQQQRKPSQQWVSEAVGPVTTFASVGDTSLARAGAGADMQQDVGDGGSNNVQLRRLGAEMSQAFKTMSILWLMTRRRAARLGYVLTALNVSYFGIIWHQTSDLATPVTAALLATLTELFLIKHMPRGRSSSSSSP